MPHRPPRRDVPRAVVSGVFALSLAVGAGVAVGQADASPAGTLLVVGDSLTVGATELGKFSGSNPSVRSAWKKVVIDAKVGRTTRQGAGIVASRARATRASAVMVALGTNDLMGRRTAREVRDLIDATMTAAGNRPVLWVNVEFGTLPARERPARARMFNSELTRATSRWPKLRIADWNQSFTPYGASRFVSDGVHLTTAGYRSRATFYAREARAFRQWIDSVVNSTTTTTDTSTTTTTSTTTSTTTVPATTSTTTTTLPATTTTTTTSSSTTTSTAPSTSTTSSIP